MILQHTPTLFDVQTYNYINLNSSINLTVPAYIEGKNSSAHGYLVADATNTNQIKLYQVSGTFIPNGFRSKLMELMTPEPSKM